MRNTRLCLFGSAKDDTVRNCISFIDLSMQPLLFLQQESQVEAPEAFTVTTFGNLHDLRVNKSLFQAFATCNPTDVIIVCDRYEHDQLVDIIVGWAIAVGISPAMHIYLNGILQEGYLETIRKHPALQRYRKTR